MDKVFAVKRVAEKLWATEDALDGAINRTAALMGDITSARLELKVGAAFGDQAINKVAEAMKALADARHAMIEAHAALEQDRLGLGVRIRQFIKPAAHPEQEPAETSVERRVG